jgi:chromosome segregation ATPase
MALLALLPLGLAADVVVLKNGQRIETRERYTLDAGMVKFTGKDGRAYAYPLAEVDLEATRRANRFAGKVWTNDDLVKLRGSAALSVTGAAAAAEPAERAEGAGAEAAAGEGGEAAEEVKPKEQDPEYWRKRLEPLRNELAQVEQQLRQSRGGQGQAASNALDLKTNAPGADVADTIQRLERRRAEIQQQIAAIEDEARRLGVPAGYVR